MMKNNIIKVAAVLSMLPMPACVGYEFVQDAPVQDYDGMLKKVQITGKDFQFEGETRSSVTITEKGGSFQWDDDDVIGIFPDQGDQVSFAMEAGAGTQTATFSGGGWALKSSAKYAAYYPHVYENRDLTKIPVSYVGQTQNGNGNTDHIGAYDFMAAGISTPENGAVAFDMQHLGALVQLTITVPEPSTLTKVVLTSSTEFTETGTIDLTAENPAITAITQSNTFEIALNDVVTTEANENVTVYFMVAPVDLSDSELTATIHFSDKSTYEVELTGKNLQTGKAYKLSAEFKEIIPNNQIWYTSSDGNVVNPFSLSFGATIKSNTYVNGRGVIEFYNNITTIGAVAFEHCSSLTSIVIPSSVKSIEVYAFSGCTSLANITISNGVTSIGPSAFWGCSSLTNIIIPNSVTDIKGHAFEDCTSLTNIVIPNSVTSIERGAFSGCTSLTNITIPDSVTKIEEHTFDGCISLSNVIIPDQVTDIKSAAFAHCSSLSNITIPNSVNEIADWAFCDCTSLTNLTIPDSVTSIGMGAFENCTSLADIMISNGVTGIGEGTFNGCTSLTNIHIPSSVTSIGVGAFENCTSLADITICNGVKIIEAYAFKNCSSLVNITIPDSVTTIGSLSFGDCSLLSRVDIKAINPPIISGSAFTRCSDNITFYVPEESVEAYKEAEIWENLNIVTDTQ